MRYSRLSLRFFATTRGRILKLLCFAPRTVSELAAHLDLTPNAIRAHLAALERDGLVRRGELRPGVRRPNYAYELSQEGEEIFPRAYGPVLRQVLEVLQEQLRPAAAVRVLREAASRLARPQLDNVTGLDPERRLARLIELLGPLVEVQRRGDTLTIRDCACPLAAVVTSHPQVCGIAAALLGELLGKPVREQCERHGESARCRFDVTWNGRRPPKRSRGGKRRGR
jgi:predicted ArsR family transcriptional regulator